MLLWGKLYVHQPRWPYPADVSSRPPRARPVPDQLERRHGARTRTVDRHVTSPAERNTIGAHGGSYALCRALAVSSGALNPMASRSDQHRASRGHRAVSAMERAGPHRIIDPWGHRHLDFERSLKASTSARPSPSPRGLRPGVRRRVRSGSSRREIVRPGDFRRTRLLSIIWRARSPSCLDRRGQLRRVVRADRGIYPELVTRRICQCRRRSAASHRIFGDPHAREPQTSLTCRVHDECSSSDVFDQTSAPADPTHHGIAECVKSAQNSGTGLIVITARKAVRSAGHQVPGVQRPQTTGRRRPGCATCFNAPNAWPASGRFQQ